MRQRWQTSKTRRSSRSSSASSQNVGWRTSSIVEILGQRLQRARGERRAVGVERVVGHGAHARAAAERLALQLVDGEADELHRADAVGVELAPVEVGRGNAGAGEVEVEVLLEADEVAQADGPRALVGEFEHQR